MEKDESPLIAVVRECTEEIGYFVNPNEIHFLREIDIKFRSRRDIVSLFEFRAKEYVDFKIDLREITEARWVRLQDLQNLALIPHLRLHFKELAEPQTRRRRD